MACLVIGPITPSATTPSASCRPADRRTHAVIDRRVEMEKGKARRQRGAEGGLPIALTIDRPDHVGRNGSQVLLQRRLAKPASSVRPV